MISLKTRAWSKRSILWYNIYSRAKKENWYWTWSKESKRDSTIQCQARYDSCISVTYMVACVLHVVYINNVETNQPSKLNWLLCPNIRTIQ